MPDYIAKTIQDAKSPLRVTDETTMLEGLTSRPVPNGNWNPKAPLDWAKNFGRRSRDTAKRLKDLVKLQEGDEGYFNVDHVRVPGVTIVRTREEARIVLERLYRADKSVLHACDTEVMDIELKTVGPVANGYVTCVSIYSGPDFDYGFGEKGTTLWIDNLDDAAGVLQEFKDWFENPDYLKVWHNYGFDRHVMWNEGIDCRGFAGDTMHMARLQDTSRAKQGQGRGYSLEALSDELLERRKKPMKEIFGIKRLRKDGTEGTLVDLPPVEVMQRDPQHRAAWITYSCYDAESTYLIRQELQKRLEKMPWIKGDEPQNLYHYYTMHMRVFGEVLTDMERRGVKVNAREYLPRVEEQARKDRAGHVQKIRRWAAKQIGPDGLALNPASSVQLCTFLFGGAPNEKTGVPTDRVRVFKVPREEIPDDAMEAYRARAAEESKGQPQEVKDDFDHMKAAQLKALCKEYGLKVSGKKAELQARLRGHFVALIQQDEQQDEQQDGATTTSSNEDIDQMSEGDLKDALVARGMVNPQGTRSQLVKQLLDDIAYTNELLSQALPKDQNGYEMISQKLQSEAKKKGAALAEIVEEAKHKSTAEPRNVDLTITSLGMKPSKYTTGGAPSVTADVLRKLAGDPFASEPKYGTVCVCC